MSSEHNFFGSTLSLLKIFADLRNFGSDLSRAHGASLSLQIGSSCQASRIFKGRHSRGSKSCGPVKFWKRPQPRPWRLVIARGRGPMSSEQNFQGSTQSRLKTLRACRFLEATSAAPMAPRYRSRSGAHVKRAQLLRVDIVAAQNFCGPEKFWKWPQPRPWRLVIARDREPMSGEQSFRGST